MRLRLAKLTRELKKYDRQLLVDELPSGVPAVFRKSVRQEVYNISEDDQKASLVVFKDSYHFIFALTDDWKATGKPVDWGLEPIMAKLKFGDLWQNETLVEDLIQSYEKADEEAARDRSNKSEAYFSEMRNQFKKDWSDINVSTLAKKDRRKLNDKKLKGF